MICETFTKKKNIKHEKQQKIKNTKQFKYWINVKLNLKNKYIDNGFGEVCKNNINI